MFLLQCPKKIGTVQHFRPSRCRKRCTVPMPLGPGMQERRTVPIFDLETLKRLVFLSFLGQYRVFAPLSLKIGTVQHRCRKHCTVPMFLGPGTVLSLKTQKNLFRVSRSKIGTVHHFRPSRCRKRCTVPMFLGPVMQTRCTVPIFELETLKRLFFWVFFLGQYGVFASLSQNDWDSTALQAFQVHQWDSHKKCEPLNNRNPTKN